MLYCTCTCIQLVCMYMLLLECICDHASCVTLYLHVHVHVDIMYMCVHVYLYLLTKFHVKKCRCVLYVHMYGSCIIKLKVLSLIKHSIHKYQLSSNNCPFFRHCV